MSVFYSSVMSNLTETALNNAIYSSIIGSNIGAFISPIGALAGIMWLGILKSHQVKYSFLDFIKYGLIIALPVATVAIDGAKNAALLAAKILATSDNKI